MKRLNLHGKVKNISGYYLKVGKKRVADGDILETPLYKTLLRLYPKYWELVEEAEKRDVKKTGKKSEAKDEKKDTKKKASKKK